MDQNTPSVASLPPPPRAKRAERAPKPPPDDEAFDQFWDAYPKKVDKGHTRRAWAKAIRAGADPEAIIAAAGRYRDDPERQAADPRFTAHAATWLNGERWLDQPSPSQARASPGGNGYAGPYRNPSVATATAAAYLEPL